MTAREEIINNASVELGCKILPNLQEWFQETASQIWTNGYLHGAHDNPENASAIEKIKSYIEKETKEYWYREGREDGGFAEFLKHEKAEDEAYDKGYREGFKWGYKEGMKRMKEMYFDCLTKCGSCAAKPPDPENCEIYEASHSKVTISIDGEAIDV